ncbi:MAG: 16S rRNA (cytosine(967)-C(5))-methyltransferase RsmB [Lachnospiraceae bacterium]|nr:16S rRNA (cytosine(967)-C(5))-methyltransferase RsmB [Lachnospiraceae bacterium]
MVEHSQERKTVEAGEKNPREVALQLLEERELHGSDISMLLKDALAKAGASLSVRDRAFVKELAVGTVERQITLDAVIDRIASVRTRRMKPVVRCAIRMGAYQILWLDGVPASAAVDESVKLVKERMPLKIAGFVNAVLRRITRERESILARLDNPETPVGERFSVPQYLCRLFKKERGREQTARICAAFLQKRPVCLRPDPRLFADEARYAEWERALTEAVGSVRHHPAMPALLLVGEPGDVRMLPGFADGLFTVQDAASALTVAAAGLKPADRVLDICAAPGGKAMYAAALLRDASQLTARDVSEEKCALLKENAERMRLSGMRIEVRDATVFDPASEEQFDTVFCDLPCSGFGVIGRKPEIKYRACSTQTDALVALQRSILENAARYVRPGGVLIYSTCTISRAENEDNVRWFTGAHPFATEPWLDAGIAGAVRSQVRDGCLQLLPGVNETDGFFIARMRKKAADDPA